MTAIEIPQAAVSHVLRATARPRRTAFPRRLRAVVARVLPDQAEALALVGEFLRHDVADAEFAARLIGAGRGVDGEPPPVRLLAARILESQVLAIDAGDSSAHRAIFDALSVDFDPRDGFTARGDADRIAQFRARLSRFAHLHAAIDGVNTTSAALERFLRSARRPCRVPLSRYLFTADETIDSIYEHTRQSRGLRDRDCESPPARERALATLPRAEAEIVRALASTHEIFWVGDRTPSEINSLVEYPLGTVALVVKPPGSNIEIEIKRAGIRGPHALDVICTRGGRIICSTHHLQGGATGKLLEWETRAEARFAAIWRAVHGSEAPVSRTLRVNNVFKMPDGRGGHANDLRYFTDPELYGDGYAHMRGELSGALASLLRFDGEPPYDAPNELARTAKFFAAVKPGQALQIGTSSFRLDRIARYLRPDGASAYFAELGKPHERGDDVAFADELLEEILPRYVPPESRSRTYRGYLRAAFAVPANRACADRAWIDCATQIGTMFGTCIAVCTGSGGESYVARNVGLRTVFEDGEWKVRVIFVDHDALNVPEPRDHEIYPQAAARAMWFDYVHIAGGRIDPMRVRGILRLLAGIYRASPALRRAQIAAFHGAVEAAFRQTRAALPPLFHAKWRERLEDFDEAVRTFVHAGRATRAWRQSIPPLLGARRQTTRFLITQYIRGIGAFGVLWRKLPYLVAKGD
jgi:hypothetical protein